MLPVLARASSARLLRVLQVVVVLLVTGSSADAWALGNSVAGMCDPVGASAPAPLPALPANGGTIDVLDDCDVIGSTSAGARDSGDSAGTAGGDSRPIAAAAPLFGVVSQRAQTLPVPAGARVAGPIGHSSGVYRPPR